jgi:hypothetical protein
MAATISTLHDNAVDRMGKTLAMGLLALALSACDRGGVPVPPSEPIRPQTVTVKQAIHVQPAVFTYTGSGQKRPPQPGRQSGDAKCCRLQV